MISPSDEVVAPEGGIRVAGVNYKEGEQLPRRYRRQLEPSQRPSDPAFDSDSAPNYGRAAVPHIWTFQGRVTGLARNYQFSDEAIRDSVANAHMMLNDPSISGPLQARQRMVALLKWSVESENDNDPKLKEAAATIQKILERTPRFTEYRRCLLEAVWYGRFAHQNVWGARKNRTTGRREYYVRKWVPTSGDKLLFRYDDGSGRYDPDQLGIKVSPALTEKDPVAGNRKFEITGEGIGYFLEPWERSMYSVHKHMIRDGEYEDPYSAGNVHGVGLRNFLYWVWYQKQETLAQLIDVVDRTASGIVIIRHAMGNPKAKSEAESVAQNMGHLNVITMPVDPTGLDTFGVDQIPANTQGIAALQDLLDDYYGDQIIRFILGQTLSTKSAATGLGSGVADFQHDSLVAIAHYDAVGLQETITDDLIRPMVAYNMPEYRDVDFFFRISTESTEPKDHLQAIKTAWDMGAKIKTRDLMDTIGLAVPDGDDEFLSDPQFAQDANALMGADGFSQDAAQMHNEQVGPGPDDVNDLGPGFEPAGETQDAEPGQGQEESEEDLLDIYGPVLNRRDGQPFRYNLHAPAGGTTIGGKRFEGGQFIPAGDLSGSTPEEQEKLTGEPSKAQAAAMKGGEGGGLGGGKQTGGEGGRQVGDQTEAGEMAKELVAHAKQTGFDEAQARKIGDCIDESKQPDDIKMEALKDAKSQMGEIPVAEEADEAADGGEDHAKSLGEMPVGEHPDGWTKTQHDAIGDIWTKEGEAKGFTNEQMASENPEDAKALHDHHAGQRSGGRRPVDTDIEKVAGIFGLGGFSARNPQRNKQFVTMAAQALGYTPKGTTGAERAQDAANYIADKAQYLEAVEELAKSQGYEGGSKNLATRAMEGAQHLVDKAKESGYQASGPLDQQILGAFKHLQSQPQDSGGFDLLGMLSRFIPGLKGKIKPAHVIGFVIGFWMVSRYADKQNRRRR